MRNLIILTTVVFALMLSTVNAKTNYRYSRDIDVDVFYGALAPHGEWIEIGYDDYVWRPYKSDYNWRPYSDGRWEWTRNGWYWVSYEDFGWATYHYGRWYNDDHYGWVWMPDNVWAPSWVEWRYNDNYVGWAPLPPYAKFNRRHGIHFSINWNSGHAYWNFVGYNHFTSYNVHNYYIDRHHTKNVFKRTKHRTNYFANDNRIVNGGIGRKFVEKKIGRKLKTRNISRTDNFSDYKSRDKRSRKGIVDYRPNERTVKKSTFDRSKVTKGRGLKSLRNEKVAINRTKKVKRSTNTKDYKDNTRKHEKKDRAVIKKNGRNSTKVVKTTKIKRNKTNKSSNEKVTKRTTVKRNKTVTKDNKSNNSFRKNNNTKTTSKKSVEKRTSVKRNKTVTKKNNETKRSVNKRSRN